MAENWYWSEEKDGNIRLGLTAATLEELGDISFVDLPKIGTELALGDSLTSIEATKAVLDFDTPFAGTIVAINEMALETPASLNTASQDDNWLVEIKK